MFILDNNQCVLELLCVTVSVQKYNVHTDEQQRQSLAECAPKYKAIPVTLGYVMEPLVGGCQSMSL